MFENQQSSVLHMSAVNLIRSNLPGALAMSTISRNPRYDLEWRGIWVSVKVAKHLLKKDDNKERWYFTLREDDRRSADIIVFICLSREGERDSVYAVPKDFIPKSSVTITHDRGRYAYFEVKDVSAVAGRIGEILNEVPRLQKLLK